MNIRPSLRLFAELMEGKLREYNYESRQSRESVSYVVGRLIDQVEELNECIEYDTITPKSSEQGIIEKCIGAASYAMMLAEKMQKLKSDT